MTSDSRVFKVIVLGDSNVGKTCLTFRFCEGRFPQRVDATIGVDFRERTVNVEGDSIRMQLWDTAGQERFRRSMIAHYYRSVNAVVFVYDVTKYESFENLQFWISECEAHSITMKDSAIPKVLIGNKSDLKAQPVLVTNSNGDSPSRNSERRVSTAAAQRFADENNMLLFETSALSDAEFETVESIFYTLALCLRRCSATPRTVSVGTSAYSVHGDGQTAYGSGSAPQQNDASREGVIQLCESPRRGSYAGGGPNAGSGAIEDDDEYATICYC